ncbi:hypothetical protein GOODEAATRI_032552, partial [Goodea atripinnis]
GRRGKGSIFVWAAGNGGMQNDHCGADGYVNSIYTIAIGAITQTGKPAYFGEPCPGVMAVTLTGASMGDSLPLVSVSILSNVSALFVFNGCMHLCVCVCVFLSWHHSENHFPDFTIKLTTVCTKVRTFCWSS